MTPQINAVLKDIRAKLEDVYGPEQIGYQPAPDVTGGVAGSGGAVNVQDATAALDLYMNAIVDRVSAVYGYAEDAATSLVFSVVGELASDGAIPDFPGEDAPTQELADWLGKAKSVGLMAQVLQTAAQAQTGG